MTITPIQSRSPAAERDRALMDYKTARSLIPKSRVTLPIARAGRVSQNLDFFENRSASCSSSKSAASTRSATAIRSRTRTEIAYRSCRDCVAHHKSCRTSKIGSNIGPPRKGAPFCAVRVPIDPHCNQRPSKLDIETAKRKPVSAGHSGDCRR